MGYPLQVGMVMAISIDGRHYGQQVLLTTHWLIDEITGGTVTNEQFFEDFKSSSAAVGGLADVYQACLSEDVTDLTPIVQIIHPNRYRLMKSNGYYGAGDIATPAPATNLAAAVTIRADVAGPHGTGNKHIGGLPSNAYEDGLIKLTHITLLDTLGHVMSHELVVDVDGASKQVTLVPLIFNKAAPEDSEIATSYVIGSTVRTMRRRTVGHGS